MIRLTLLFCLVLTASACTTQSSVTEPAESPVAGATQDVVTEPAESTAAAGATRSDAIDESSEPTAPLVTSQSTDEVTDTAGINAPALESPPLPLRLRPGHVPEGFSLEAVHEMPVSGISGQSWVYGLPDAGNDPLPQITVSVSTGAEIGLFETRSSLHALGYGIDPIVDVNGIQAISSTLIPVIYWVAEGDTRVSVSGGVDISSGELLEAARGLEHTSDGPRIKDGALPEGFELVGESASQEFGTHWTSLRLTKPDGKAMPLLSLMLSEWLAPRALTGSTPSDPISRTSRWERSVSQPLASDRVQVSWSERDGVSAIVSAPPMPESELVAFIDGLEVVSEEDWQTFLEQAFPRGTPTPNTGAYRFSNILVLAAPDDSKWTWLERGHHLGGYWCAQAYVDPGQMREYVLVLPEHQIGAGFADIEALTEEQRTFPCEP